MDIFVRVLKEVLGVVYQYSGMAIVFAVVFMFVYMQIRDNGFKKTTRMWISKFKESSEFRRVFVCVFYIVILMGRTVFCRPMTGSALSNVLGPWFYDKKGNFLTEGIDNLLLFIPVTPLLIRALEKKLFKDKPVTFWRTLGIGSLMSFGISAAIEVIQLFLKIGSFQISDLAFNTAGGILGTLIYYICYKIHSISSGRKNKDKDKSD